MHVGIIAFCASAAFIAYVFAGYPLILWLLARFPAPAVRRRPHRPTVTVLLPVHNGERWIRGKLESLLKLEYPRHLVQILVLSDGSTDATEAIAGEYAGQGVEVVPLPRGGKPAALNAGMERATGEIVFFTDVRQYVDPACLTHLVECLADPTVGVVSGQLVIGGGATNEEASVGAYWRFEVWLRRQLNRAGSMIVVCGCVHAVRREMLRPIPRDLLIDDVYLPAHALLKGYRVYLEEQAKVYDYPAALDAEFYRKARTLAGLFQLVRYCPRLLLPVYRRWGHFVSYKLARLLVPYALLGVLAGSFALPGPLAWLAAAPQGAFYLLAALDPHIPERWRMKRFSALARTFVVLMLATLCAARVFFVPAERIWKPTTKVRAAGAGSAP